MVKTVWKLREEESGPLSAEFIEAAGGSPLLAKLLALRGLETPEAVRAFLELDAYTPTSGIELPDMEKAVARTLEAIDKQENILVFGDFDVDGQTGTSVLMETLRYLYGKKASK